MAAAFRSATSSSELSTSTDVTITAPAGLQDGDLIIAFSITRTLVTLVNDPPTGWTKIAALDAPASDAHLYAAYKVASSEGASWTWSGLYADLEQHIWGVVCYSGVDTTTPLDGVSPVTNTGTDASVESGNITAASNGAMLVHFAGCDSSGVTMTPDSSPTCNERIDNSGIRPAIWLQDYLQATAAQISLDMALSTTDNWASAIVALKPSSGSADSTLTVNDLAYSMSVDAPLLSQLHNIDPADLSYAYSMDGAVLTQVHNLTVADLDYIYYAYVGDGSVLKQQHNLTPTDLSYSYGIDAVALTQAHNLIVNDLAYAMTLNNVAMGGAVVLVVNDLAYTQSIDGIDVVQAHMLSAADLSYALSIDAVSLTQDHVLSVNDLDYLQSLDSVTLSQAHLLTVQDLLYSYGIDTVNWTTATGKVVISFQSGGVKILVTAKGNPRIVSSARPMTITATN